MTPSDAHDSAWQRGSDHDEMTIACRDILERDWKKLNFSWFNQSQIHDLTGVWCEQFMTSDRSKSWFADIFARWDVEYERNISGDRKIKESHTVYAVLEIKPKLYSAGALLRQMRVQKERLKAWAENQSRLNNVQEFSTFVDAVAIDGDPMIETFCNLGRVSLLVWDGGGKLRRHSCVKDAK